MLSKSLSSELERVTSQLQTLEEQQAKSLRQLTTELAESKFHLTSVQQKLTTSLQDDQSALQHLASRLRLSEEQVSNLRLHLATAELAIAQHSHEKALLLARIASLEEEAVNSGNEAKAPVESDQYKEELARLTGELERLQVVRERDAETTAVVYEDATAFIDSQAKLIERLRMECASLLENWDHSERARLAKKLPASQRKMSSGVSWAFVCPVNVGVLCDCILASILDGCVFLQPQLILRLELKIDELIRLI